MARRKKPKSDDAQPRPASRPAGYRDWDNIIPGEPMAPQPYAEQSWQSAPQTNPTQPQPQAPPAAVPAQQPYQQPVAQPQYPQQPQQQPPAQPQQYQQPAAQPQQYQQPAAQPQQYQQPAPGGPAPGAPPAPAGAVNPTDGSCTKCGAAFGQKAACDGCGAGRTACFVCGTKIWAGALTCSAHSNAMRR